ncbi:hypothetical protein [Chryseolinea soli]|uniref:hypothetical protein n=1 Tax=Chryseolinea soli TaxID=2321403 RepID=UPI00135A70AA|nr:hypothetical protein [Chryseolinea soli]
MPIKPNPIATHCFIGLCTLTLFATCQTEKIKQQPATFYDAILGQIVYDRYYSCLDTFLRDKNLMKIDSAYWKGSVSVSTFSRLVAALKRERKNMNQKCKITFHPDLGRSYSAHTIPDVAKKELQQILVTDTAFQQTFPGDQALDSLFIPCGLHASDFNIDFLQIEPPPQKRRVLYSSISLSMPVFNSNKTRAVLYCEYHGDSPYGEGVFVFVEKQEGEWKVYKYLVNWQS